MLPKKIGGSLSLDDLASAEGLMLPTEIGGYLNLNGLTSAEGLVLPGEIDGDLELNGLTSAEDLWLSDIHGALYLNHEQADLARRYWEQA